MAGFRKSGHIFVILSPLHLVKILCGVEHVKKSVNFTMSCATLATIKVVTTKATKMYYHACLHDPGKQSTQLRKLLTHNFITFTPCQRRKT